MPLTVTAPRVLVIAYDFPPHGAIGTMRTLRLVRQLAAEGWAITVLTGHPDTYLPGTPIDATLQAQVPPGVRVLQVRAFRPLSAIQRRLRRGGSRARAGASDGRAAMTAPRSTGGRRHPVIRALVALKHVVDAALDIPDRESGWMAPAVIRGIRHALSHGRPAVIYSTAPPWSGQVVAFALASLFRRPWMADFRDPWARAPWRDWRRPFRQRAAAVLERLVVRRADSVVFVTQANRAEYAECYGAGPSSRFHLIPNGCDPSEFDGMPRVPPRDGFVLLHAGTLYGGRSPIPVLRGAAAAVARGAIDRRRFRLRFLGHVSPEVDLPGESRRLGIEDLVEVVPRVTRDESLREMQSASALLLIQTGTTVSVPGKAYEYLAAGRPVLALSEEGETADLVRASGIGVVVRPQDAPDVLADAVLRTMALAAGAPVAAPRELFDGRIHARTAVAALRQLAGQDGEPAQAEADVAKPHRIYGEDSAR